MCQVLCGELGMADQLGELHVDIVEGALERGCNGADTGECGGRCRAEDSVIGAGEEQRGAPSEVGDPVAEAFGQAFDEAVEAQAAELIGHGALGDLLWGAAGQGGKMAAQIVATQAVGDLAEHNERLQELMGARVGKAKMPAWRSCSIDSRQLVMMKSARRAVSSSFSRRPSLSQPPVTRALLEPTTVTRCCPGSSHVPSNTGTLELVAQITTSEP